MRIVRPGSTRTPRVSVLMPAYNRAPEIDAALESVRAQDFEDFEIIVVDDGSTDNTAQVVRGFEPDVQLVVQPNKGVSGARNTALRLARGELIAYCDADDLQFPFRLAAQTAALDRFPEAGLLAADFSSFIDHEIVHRSHLRARWLGPSTAPLDRDLRRVFPQVHRAAALGLPLPPEHAQAPVYFGEAAELVALLHFTWGCSLMFRRQAARLVGDHVESLRAYDDWYLAGRIARRHPLLFLDVPVCRYRTHAEQLTGRPRLNIESYLWVIENIWRQDRPFAAAHPALIRKLLGTAYHDLGRVEALEGHWDLAEAHFRRALVHWPILRRGWGNLALAELRHRWPGFRGSPLDQRLPTKL